MKRAVLHCTMCMCAIETCSRVGRAPQNTIPQKKNTSKNNITSYDGVGCRSFITYRCNALPNPAALMSFLGFPFRDVP